MKKLSILWAGLLSLLMLNATAQNTITKEEFEKLSPKEAVALAHQWHRKGIATVVMTPTEIQAMLPNKQKASIPLGDEFFLSVAPYQNKTHECDFHVPTGCTGEMIGKKMRLKITDKATGEVIKDEKVKTQHDGFLDLWLPRDKEFLFEFTYKGKTASQTLSTFGDSHTCVTTVQFK